MSANTSPRGKRPDRRKAPTVAPQPPRKMELIGLTNDGRMLLWIPAWFSRSTASRHRLAGKPFIVGGHYVIEWKAHAITVHCSSVLSGGRWCVGVLFMCGRRSTIPMARRDVKAMLIGKVIRDPVVDAQIMESLERAKDAIASKHDVPHRQRGRIS
jgi:hypothetical protein